LDFIDFILFYFIYVSKILVFIGSFDGFISWREEVQRKKKVEAM
jgi:hypothetical protein